jgi:hypothetical protein
LHPRQRAGHRAARRSANRSNSLPATPSARPMRSSVSVVAMRRCVSMKLNICRESRDRAASCVNDHPCCTRRSRMTPPSAKLAGSRMLRERGENFSKSMAVLKGVFRICRASTVSFRA